MKDLIHTEKTILGSLLFQVDEYAHALELIRDFHFSQTAHQHIYRAIEQVHNNRQPVDTVTITNQVKKMGLLDAVGGAYYIAELTKFVEYSNLTTHCLIVIQEFMNRQLQIIGAKIQNQSATPGNDPCETMAEIERDLEALDGKLPHDSSETLATAKDQLLANCAEVLKSGKRSGILIGLEKFDRYTNGLQPGTLTIVAGRPGAGKSAFGLTAALHASMNGVPAAFINLEMQNVNLAARALSIVSGLNLQKLDSENLNQDELRYAIEQGQNLDNLPFYLEDQPAISIQALRNKARRMKRQKNIGLLVVDYLQLMSGSGKKNSIREQEIAEISRSLKALAKELKIPVIAMAQLNRDCDSRPDKKPQLSDLRESGAIEQDADMVILCHRPEYYGIERYSQRVNGHVQEISTEQLMVLIIAKFRHGATGELRAKFVGSQAMVTNYLEHTEQSF